MIEFLGRKYYTFEEAIEITSKCQLGGSNGRHVFETSARTNMKIWQSLAVEGISSFVFPDNSEDSWFKVGYNPCLLVGNIVLHFQIRSWRKASATDFYLGGNPVFPIHSSWKYNAEEPKRVLKATDKSLQKWCDYLIERRNAIIAYNEEVLNNRLTAVPAARKKLIDAGFETLYKYEKDKPEESNKFICVRGGVRCIADIDEEGIIHTRTEVDYYSTKELFADVL